MEKFQQGTYNLQEVAQMLAVSRLTVYRYIQLGKLKGFQLPATRGLYGRWRVWPQDLNTFLHRDIGRYTKEAVLIRKTHAARKKEKRTFINEKIARRLAVKKKIAGIYAAQRRERL